MNPYEMLRVDLIKSTPIVLIEVYKEQNPYWYNDHYEEKRAFFVRNDDGYIRLYLKDGEVLQLGIREVEFCLIQDDVLYDHIREKGGHTPWTALPDILYYTNAVRQVVAYLVHKTCRVETNFTPKPLNPLFAAEDRWR